MTVELRVIPELFGRYQYIQTGSLFFGPDLKQKIWSAYLQVEVCEDELEVDSVGGREESCKRIPTCAADCYNFPDVS